MDRDRGRDRDYDRERQDLGRSRDEGWHHGRASEGRGRDYGRYGDAYGRDDYERPGMREERGYGEGGGYNRLSYERYGGEGEITGRGDYGGRQGRSAGGAYGRYGWDFDRDMERGGEGRGRMRGGDEMSDWDRSDLNRGGYSAREGRMRSDWDRGGPWSTPEREFMRGNYGYTGDMDQVGYGRGGTMSDGDSPSEGPYAGVGPQGYERSAERIKEDVHERFMRHGQLDPSNIQITVENSEVTLEGTVDSRQAKRLAENIAESVTGVRDVHNRLRIERSDEGNRESRKGRAGAQSGQDAESAKGEGQSSRRSSARTSGS